MLARLNDLLALHVPRESPDARKANWYLKPRARRATPDIALYFPHLEAPIFPRISRRVGHKRWEGRKHHSRRVILLALARTEVQSGLDGLIAERSWATDQVG